MLFEDKVDINETKLLQEYPEVLDFLLKEKYMLTKEEIAFIESHVKEMV